MLHALRYTALFALSLTGLLALAGCRASATVGPAPMSSSSSATVSDQDALIRLCTNITTARTATQEADALKALHQYEADHQLTYTSTATRIDTNTTVQSPSVNPYPLRVDVALFKGQTPVYTFSFVPHDNRNLALLGG